jgi:hypothetical protein
LGERVFRPHSRAFQSSENRPKTPSEYRRSQESADRASARRFVARAIRRRQNGLSGRAEYALASVGSFSKAAIATNTKTLTVLRAIAGLEEDLDVSLFHRTTRHARIKYSKGQLKLFAGDEYIVYALPSNPYAAGTGFNDISGDFACAGCAAINNTKSTTRFSTPATSNSMYSGPV